MAEDDQDESQKTEDPTQHKLNEAIKKGQVAFSREVTSFLILSAFAIVIIWLAPYLFKRTTVALMGYIEHAAEIPVDSISIHYIVSRLFSDVGSILLFPALAALTATIVSAFGQNGIIASVEPIIPKLEKISIFKGVKRLFSLKSMVELLKGILKISLVAIVGFIAVYPELIRMETIHTYAMDDVLALIYTLTIRILIGACVIMGFVAVADYLYQKHEYIKNLRMSKKDIKDEMKQTEGNPEIKAKLRQIRMERAQQRMMSAVPTADVVITNPTHFSIALKYDQETMRAPVCVARGQDHIALKIREIAKEHDITIVENPPLARALFNNMDIDEEIPNEQYQAVAEVISYVYKLKGKL